MIAHVPLGGTGLVVSRLGLGLAAVGRPGYINLGRAHDLPAERTPAALDARTAGMLDAAHAAGIRYVDAARSYGLAEEFLARWLTERQVPRAAITVGSKWGYRYTAGWAIQAPVHEEKELSLARFETQLAESEALLGDRLDLYQIHSAEPAALDNEALLQALVAARHAGRYRAIGLTLSGTPSARVLEAALAARVGGEGVFDVVQATFNVLEPSLAVPLARAHAAGLGVIAKEVVANGRLTDANERAGDFALIGRLRAIAGDLPLDRLAIAFAVAQPFIDVVLSGAATTAQLASHVAALEVRLDGSTRAALVALAEPQERYWPARAALPWA